MPIGYRAGVPAGYKNSVPPRHPARPDPMTRLLQPLWLLLAVATDRELATMVEYLKA